MYTRVFPSTAGRKGTKQNGQFSIVADSNRYLVFPCLHLPGILMRTVQWGPLRLTLL